MRDVWFKGGLSSRIRLEERWTISDDVFNSTAVTNAPKDSFALGKWEWTVTGDHVNCHKGKLNIKKKPHYVLFLGEPYTTFLKFTGCLEGQFTCDDGECIQMEQRRLFILDFHFHFTFRTFTFRI